MKAGDAVQFYPIDRDEYDRVAAIAGLVMMAPPQARQRRQAGMLTTVQDMGRWGFQAQGVPVAGPMDPFSHRLANALAGNDRDAALLEVTLLGPELAFEDERLVAVTGAEFDLSLDGRPVAVETAPFVGPRRIAPAIRRAAAGRAGVSRRIGWHRGAAGAR